MQTAFYRFETRADFLAAAAAAGWFTGPDGALYTAGGAVFDEIGPLVAAATVGVGGRPVAGAPLDARWHVNVAWKAEAEPAAFTPAKIEPATPARVFAVPDPPPPTPQYTPDEVPAWKGRIVLSEAGLLATVEAAVAAAPTRIKTAWAHKPTWRRGSPMVDAMAQAVGLSPAQVRALFRDADAIQG